MSGALHLFQSSGAAYDACQCDAAIQNGAVLLIEGEGVVGLAGTWPVAITVAAGDLHIALEGRLRDYLASMNMDRHLDRAISIARHMGFALNPELEEEN